MAGKCRWASAHLRLPTEMKSFRLTDSTFDHVGRSILGGQNSAYRHTLTRGRTLAGDQIFGGRVLSHPFFLFFSSLLSPRGMEVGTSNPYLQSIGTRGR